MQGVLCALKPEPSPAPAWVQFNDALALELGLEPTTLKSATGLAWLSAWMPRLKAAPLAPRPARDHQFGQFSPPGDGRALLLRELIDTAGQRRDHQPLRGRAVPPFSPPWRWQGEHWGPALREYLMGEDHARVGHSPTRALAVIRTGERVNREGLARAILVRVAASRAGGHF